MSRSDQKRFRTPSPLAGYPGEARSTPLEGRGEGERHLTHVAKRLRHEMTDAERVLWREVRAHRFAGLKFKRQEPLGLYVVDLVCYEAKLIIELDGGHHADQQEADAERTRWLESRGFRVIRFWNNDVLTNIAGVMQELEGELNPLRPSPSPLSPALSRERRGRVKDDQAVTDAKKKLRTPSPLTGEGRGEGEKGDG